MEKSPAGFPRFVVALCDLFQGSSWHFATFWPVVPTSLSHQRTSLSSHGGGGGDGDGGGGAVGDGDGDDGGCVASASTLVARKSNEVRSMVRFIVWSLYVCSPGQ